MDDVLLIKAKHFKNTDFESNYDCAMAKAAREQFHVTGNINAGTHWLHVNDRAFYKVVYTYSLFKEDKAVAASKNYSEDVVRKLQLVREE